MTLAQHWTIADLAAFPDNGYRYEIIAGELYVSKQPHWHHQFVCTRITYFLEMWNERTQAGLVLGAPGVVFADDEAVAPDLVWISRKQFATAAGTDGKLHATPELMIEVLSPGLKNAERDRDEKRALYDRRGVTEYWIVDWQQQQVELYRRAPAILSLVDTLTATDTLTSPLLPGFTCPVAALFIEM